MANDKSNVNNNFGRPKPSLNRNNPFNLKRSTWFIDGDVVNATAAQLNSAGSGGGISAIQVPLPMTGFINIVDGYCFSLDLSGPIAFAYSWTSSIYPPSSTSSYSFIPTGTETIGTQVFNLQIGIYRFYVTFIQDTNVGIFDFVTQGPNSFNDTQTIDMYNDTRKYNIFFWDMTIVDAGVYTMSIISNNKNVLSSDFRINIGEISGVLIS